MGGPRGRPRDRELGVLALSILVMGTLGCTVAAGDPGRDGSASQADTGVVGDGGAHETSCTGGVDDDLDGLVDCDDPDCVSSPRCLRDGGVIACESRSVEADPGVAPLDVVWVIDSSGSMDQEAAIVQDSMNAFAAAIGTAGIPDYHVVVVSSAGWVDVPAPLGTDPAHFLAIDEFVDSKQPLTDAIARYPDYAAFLRPEAALHFVFVTDDDSTITGSAFVSMMTALVGRPFVVHAIASPDAGGTTSTGACDGPYGMADAIGLAFLDATSATDGLFEDICASDWGPIFTRLLTTVAVPQRLPCTFDIPAPPTGMTFDRNRVNVTYRPGDGSTPVTFPRSDDCASGQAWHYDVPADPHRVVLCVDACGRVTPDTTGAVDIDFGCQTIVF